jgi:hypothetical protein
MEKKEMSKPKPKAEIYWLPDPDYQKACFKLRGAFLTLLDNIYCMYGYKEFNPEVANQLFKLAEDFSLVCRGVDKPIIAKGVR